MDKIRESEIEYRMFLDSWQDITAPSGKEIHLNGFIEGQKSRDEEIKKLRKVIKEFLDWWGSTDGTFLVVIKNMEEVIRARNK